MEKVTNASDLLAFFDHCGGTDRAYLSHHFGRFRATIDELLTGWTPEQGARVLDVGAHWLHQAAILHSEGFKVTAVDLPITFELECVKSAAERMQTALVPITNLSMPVELNAIPDDSHDLLIFSEIIEHITFNPIEFWKQIYRILRKNGRIIVTTPNYYSPYSRIWDIRRFLSGFGGGITVDEILLQHTYAHHWKEFTARELIYYFARLSPDFNTVKFKHFPAFEQGTPKISRLARLAYFLKNRDPRDHANIYLEVEIREKQHGIVIEPSW
ncbi:MAG: class I SAM-dependent methyltransferase [Xanthomonadales bacterium]|jgi:2-polyprenyl-6-hydroxyphenyl methylase/3-demethylubiquinone-9 3-methyltransferase|nr:class I SAM-dependent methyltransferase [Xanthomonadales bacterium]